MRQNPGETIVCDCLVIGSGPGGATTARLLTKAGRDVLIVEEGIDLKTNSSISYSLTEMKQKYRNGGLTAAFGRPNISFVEACCVGGGSEINAALYHRPLESLYEDWHKEFGLKDFSKKSLGRYFLESENDLCVSEDIDGQIAPAAKKLKQGAAQLDWEVVDLERCWRNKTLGQPGGEGDRESMSRTLIPKSISDGGRLLTETRVLRIITKGNIAESVVAVCGKSRDARIFKINFRSLFVCAGATQTPFLLRKSGITRNIGNSLKLHAMIRVVAEFSEVVNYGSNQIPGTQVQEFKPDVTLGCSNSSRPFLGLWLAGQREDVAEKLARWERMAIYYAAITPKATGRVRAFPGLNCPFVRYQLLDEDFRLLGKSLYRLSELLFSGGAIEIDTPISGHRPITRLSAIQAVEAGIPRGQTQISSIHLFSSCPMGEDRSRAAVDSFGQLFDYQNVYLNDSSILPTCPGVNPQALIMAIARRNIDKFLNR